MGSGIASVDDEQGAEKSGAVFDGAELSGEDANAQGCGRELGITCKIKCDLVLGLIC